MADTQPPQAGQNAGPTADITTVDITSADTTTADPTTTGTTDATTTAVTIPAKTTTAETRNYWQGQRVRLRAVEPGDGETHFLWNQDGSMSQALDRIHFPQSLVAARQWADKATQGPEGDAFHFEIENMACELVGAIATHNCDPRNGTFAYGVAIRAEHQRQGFASEAIRLVLRYYFQELRYQKVTVHVYSFNAASLVLHEKLGFKREGVLRRMIYTGGVFHDIIVYGLTADEFGATARG